MQTQSSYLNAALRKFPEQIAIVIAKDDQGKFNPVTISWIMTASANPPMMAFAVARNRYSLESIRSSKEFVIALPAADQEREVVEFGTKSGREIDKIAECGTETAPAKVVDGVLLSGAVANFECKLESELEVGDHVIVVGSVVASHVNKDEDLKRIFSLGGNKMGGLSPS
jgi:flavin reductase (DIM6/NTAB) family NADH-FMN oxidoreductase RutF